MGDLQRCGWRIYSENNADEDTGTNANYSAENRRFWYNLNALAVFDCLYVDD
jgi:hypothetical protein